jgi:septal ring factor EnvC (AmiA/AmiB activator)
MTIPKIRVRTSRTTINKASNKMMAGNKDEMTPLVKSIEESVRQEAEDKGKTLTQAEVDKIVADRVARERKKFADYDDLKKKAAKLQQIEDGQKTEAQKLNDQLAAQSVELQELRVEKIRRAAASAAGLDPDLAEFITAADEGEATEQARKLAERLKANTKSTAPDFKQGTRSTPPPTRSRDELLRGLAGFGAN